VSRKLEEIMCHPSHSLLTHENDICLLKLSAPVEFTDFIQPVCLASTGSTFHSGVSSWVTGFGVTHPGKITDAIPLSPNHLHCCDFFSHQCESYLLKSLSKYSSSRADILQEVNLPIVGNNECGCTYTKITENTICAGFREGGKDSCKVTTTFLLLFNASLRKSFFREQAELQFSVLGNMHLVFQFSSGANYITRYQIMFKS